MKFSIDREALLRPLQIAARASGTQATMPILAHVRMLADREGGLTLSATDNTVEATVRVGGAEVPVRGGTTAPARKLADIWRTLPEGERVDVELEGEQVVIRSGANIFSLAMLPTDDYPASRTPDDAVAFALDAADACEMIDRVSFAMANQDVRYFLNGMLLVGGEGHVRAVATDGHRLAQWTLPQGVDGTRTDQAIIPRNAVLEARRLIDPEAGTVAFAFDGGSLRITQGDCELTARLIDGRFPDYERVIPQTFAHSFSVDRNEFAQALGQARILADEKFPGAKIGIEGDMMSIVASNPNQEEARLEVPVEHERDGALEMGFNVLYLLDILRSIESETVRFSVAQGDGTALIAGAGDDRSLHVVMPMKL